MRTRLMLIISAAVLLLFLVSVLTHWHSVRQRRAGPVKIRFAEKAAKKRLPIPPEAKRADRPKVAIVIDDFGYNKNNLEGLFAIDLPVTLSVLPGLRYSSEIAAIASSRGYEVILHLPLEAWNKEKREEVHTIKSGMTEEEAVRTLDMAIAGVPGLKGVSNHMGSKATEDRQLMSIILKRLKERGLYFFDSLTSSKSVCRDVARPLGLPCARRDIFLDNSNDPAGIEKQLEALRKRAFRYGRAIAICHDRKNTIKALAKAMPEMVRDGIEFVPLSKMVRSATQINAKD